MALYKPIRQEDGVVTNYHRVLYVHNTVNQQSSIAVVSYIDEQNREDELNSITPNPYKKAITYETDYDENMTPEKAYEFLKSLPVFEGATDV